jgi:S-adenosylmethionine hydrolase
LKLVSLTTDFGLKDPYVGQLKAALLTVCPDVVIVDVTHEIEKYNVAMGGIILASTVRFFPEGSIHVGVVDPGVGGPRRPIIMETERSMFVGPDNGLLAMAAEQEGIKHVFEITEKRYMRREVSRTFHGRDVFAPVAGHLANGVNPRSVGKEVKDYTPLRIPRPTVERGLMEAQVLYVDSFGNVVTNVKKTDLEEAGLNVNDEVKIEVKSKVVKASVKEAYYEAERGKPVLLLGSQGFVEIALREGSAAKLLKLSSGEKLWVKLKGRS